MQPSAATSRYPELGAWEYWPGNPFWSFQVVRLVEQANYGGADFAEIHSAVKDLPEGDGEAWYDAFKRLADEVQAKAEGAAAGGHRVSAREAWFRASNYHRSAGFFLSPADPRHGDTVLGRRQCFQAAADRAAAEIRSVEIPFEGASLPGWIFGPAEPTGKPTPAVVIFGGTDAVAEEMYFFLGRALADRGFLVLSIDGPGQGEALRRGIYARADFEVAVTAAIDHLLERDDVDPERLGLVGQSLGAFYAVRAAAFEPRLKACVVWGASYDVHASMRRHVDSGSDVGVHFTEVFKVLLGAGDADEVFTRLEAFTLDGVTERVHVPTLIVHGENDLLCALADAERVVAEIRSDDKELIVYPMNTPGCTHCQVDALAHVHYDMCNWLETRLSLAS
jgi:dipeptidyl aminopeptidase/acylaminoacyl peptidase